VYGKGPIGFVNPALYANPGVLNDIVNGTNLGCDSDGFQAVPGYVIDFGGRLITY
jgi:tripeptidyl-peptidase I